MTIFCTACCGKLNQSELRLPPKVLFFFPWSSFHDRSSLSRPSTRSLLHIPNNYILGSVSNRILWALWRQVTSHKFAYLWCHCIKFAYRRDLALQICFTLWTVTYCNTTECPIKRFTLYFLKSYIKVQIVKTTTLFVNQETLSLYSLNHDL